MGGFKMAVNAPPRRATTRVASTGVRLNRSGAANTSPPPQGGSESQRGTAQRKLAQMRVAPTSTDGMRRQDRHWHFAAALFACLLVTIPGGAEAPAAPAAT